jgi:isovaleryl-CoA dehydrogenase
MLGPALTDEQVAFRDAIRDFCQRECGTREQRAVLTEDGAINHNHEIYARLAELGWIGVGLPERHGGGGGGAVEQCILIEETQYGLLPIHALRTSLIVAGNYERGGSEPQKERMLRAICNGAVQAIAMSEPEAGSDVAAVRCRAVAENGHFRINGQKTWCSNARIAEQVLLVCRTADTGRKHEGLTMLEVPVGTPGMELRPIDTMGGDETNDVFFTDCLVPDTAVVGEAGGAWRLLMAGLNIERLIIAALMLGHARRTLDDLLAYVTQRRQFGRTIGSFQALKHRIADLATDVECCQLLTYAVAREVDEDPATMLPREASMAKLKVTEVAKRVALEGMQMMGGYGYATEHDMEGHVRKSLVTTILGGTSEIQREIIAKTYGL